MFDLSNLKNTYRPDLEVTSGLATTNLLFIVLYIFLFCYPSLTVPLSEYPFYLKPFPTSPIHISGIVSSKTVLFQFSDEPRNASNQP